MGREEKICDAPPGRMTGEVVKLTEIIELPVLTRLGTIRGSVVAFAQNRMAVTIAQGGHSCQKCTRRKSSRGAAEIPVQWDTLGAGKLPIRVSLLLRNVYSTILDCWTLTKPEVNFLIVLATATGFYLGNAHQAVPFPFLLLMHTLVGTLLVASGTATLNQYIERHFDAQMRRTARRPLAAARMRAPHGLALGVALAGLGTVLLAVRVNLLTSAFAMFTLSAYLLIYTPLKRRSPACTLIGAIPGAMPPLIGWAGASGHLNSEAWLLFGILFLWQLPHFMAIAWMYRDDYERAGFCVLPLATRRRTFVNWMIVLPLVALIPLTLSPAFFGHADAVYAMGALVTGSLFLYRGSLLALHKSNQRARELLYASIAYLPIVFALLVTRAR
jgi:protoheme IX farnesyltransferase